MTQFIKLILWNEKTILVAENLGEQKTTAKAKTLKSQRLNRLTNALEINIKKKFQFLRNIFITVIYQLLCGRETKIDNTDGICSPESCLGAKQCDKSKNKISNE